MNLAGNDACMISSAQPARHLAGRTERPGVRLNKGGYYLNSGIALGHTWGPVTVSLPITSALGSRGFYNGEGFGYFAFGPQISVPITFLNASEKLTFSGGYTFYEPGSAAADAGSPTVTASSTFQGGVGLDL